MPFSKGLQGFPSISDALTVSQRSTINGLQRSQPVVFETMLPRKAPMDRPAFDQMSVGASVRVAAHGFRKASWLLAADAAGDDGM